MAMKNGIRTFTRFVAGEVREATIGAVTVSPRFAIATETAPETARAGLPGPDIPGDAFVLAARLPLDASGQYLAYERGKLVRE